MHFGMHFLMRFRMHSGIANGESACEKDGRRAAILPEMRLPCKVSAAARYCYDILFNHVHHRQDRFMRQRTTVKSNSILNFCIPLATLLGSTIMRVWGCECCSHCPQTGSALQEMCMCEIVNAGEVLGIEER